MGKSEFITPFLVAVVLISLWVFAECENPARAADAALINHWDAQTHVWTARAAVAEVGWHSGRSWTEAKQHAKEAEQIAVWFVLRARLIQMRKRWPKLRFLDVLKAYCAVGTRGVLTPRQRWIRQLTLDGTQPPGWPRSASWPDHQPLWLETLDRAEIWAQSKSGNNPCPGANHFGGLRAGDIPRGKMARHPCSNRFERFNGSTFYTVERR